MKDKEKKNRKNANLLLIGLFLYSFVLIFVFYQGDNAYKESYLKKSLYQSPTAELVEYEIKMDWQKANSVDKKEPKEPYRITEDELGNMLDLVSQFVEVLPYEKSGNFAFKNMDDQTQANLIGFAQELEYREIEELEKFMIATGEDNLEVYTNEGEVKSWWDDIYDKVDKSVQNVLDSLRDFLVGTCSDSEYEILDPQLFCGSEGLTGSEEIKMAQIWSVDIKSVGSAYGFDNLLLTHNPHLGQAVWRNDSTAIMEDFDYDINMPPNPSLRDSVKLSEEERFEHYEMHYEAAGKLNEIPYDVHPDEESLCPDVLNPGHFNVKGSNNLQKEMTDSISPPGLMALGNRSFSINLCEDPFFQEDFDEDETFLLCNEGFFDILKCLGENLLKFRDTCPEIEGVFVDATLGSGQICNEDDCSSRYWEAGREITSPPTWTEDLHHPSMTKEDKENDYSANHPDETVIFTTPCYLRIDCEICPTRCFWDVSLLKHIFEQEGTYTYPGFKNTPKVEDYLQRIVDEIKFRARFGSHRY